METTTMGKVSVAAKIENIADLYAVDNGTLRSDQVRCVDVSDALVDTGATMLSLPRRMIAELGLKRFRTRHARTTTGVSEFAVYGTVQLTVQGRDCRVDVTEVPDDCPVLIGQVPRELLDFVVDPVGRQGRSQSELPLGPRSARNCSELAVNGGVGRALRFCVGRVSKPVHGGSGNSSCVGLPTDTRT